jgi:hypothetical protein
MTITLAGRANCHSCMLDVSQLGPAIVAELLPCESLHQIAPHLDDLAGRTIEPNVYFTRPYLTALLRNLPDPDVAFAVVWQGPQMIGFLPVRADGFPYSPFTPSRAWQSLYTFSCTPLIDRTLAPSAAEGLVRVLADAGRNEWHMPRLNVDGLACREFLAALQRSNVPFAFCDAFERASFDRSLSFEEYMAGRLSARRRKDLLRNRRRLDARGVVKHTAHTQGNGLRQAVQAFLSLEARGWKGQKGTAFASAASTKSFAEQAFHGCQTRVDLLSINDLPIAASVAVMAGRVAFTVKCAFDESFRSYSAGLLLELEVIRSFLSEGWADRLDAATAGAHVIDELWPDRMQVADLVLSFAASQPQLRLAALKKWHDIKREVKGAIRSAPVRGLAKALQPLQWVKVS